MLEKLVLKREIIHRVDVKERRRKKDADPVTQEGIVSHWLGGGGRWAGDSSFQEVMEAERLRVLLLI